MLTATAPPKNFLRRLFRQREYEKLLSGDWCSISSLAIGYLFAMHGSIATAMDCPTVTATEIKIANTPTSFINLGDIAGGILITSDINATAPQETINAELVHELQSGHLNAYKSLLKAFAYGPEIAGEDDLTSTEVRCTSAGIAIDQVVRLAIPPATGSRRRSIVWRPILSILLKAKGSFQLDVRWIKRSSDRVADVVVTTHKEIDYAHQ